MRVTYIYHSCFMIEWEDFSILFDFFRDAPREDGSLWVNDYLLSKKEDLYVLCSHSHSDHFNPDILTWGRKKENIRYIFSDELKKSGKIVKEEVCFLAKKETYTDDRLIIQAFGSTDIGGSFLIKYNDQFIFHAGDLNNWHWNEEVSKEEALSYENLFLCELELLAERADHLQLTMFPVDPRLGKDYMRGPEQFVERIKTDYFLPMHFGEKKNEANRFEKIAKRYGCNFLSISHVGQSFYL